MENGEKLYTLTLDSGIPVYIRPLSPYARAAISDQANTQYPDPDPAGYERDDPNGFPGLEIKIPADQNEEYLQERRRAIYKRMNAVNYAIINSGVVCDSPLGKDFLIDHYAPLRERINSYSHIQADLWHITVLTCLIRTYQDAVSIANAASEIKTADEVRRGMESFRRDVQFATPDSDTGKQEPPSP